MVNWSSKRVQGVVLIALGLLLDVLDLNAGLRLPEVPVADGALTLYGALYATGYGWLVYGAVDAHKKASRPELVEVTE